MAHSDAHTDVGIGRGSDGEPRDVTRRRMLAATGVAATGIALSSVGEAVADPRGAGLAPPHATVATFIAVLESDGDRLDGWGFLTDVYGLRSLALEAGSDIPSALALRVEARSRGRASHGGVVLARSEGVVTFFEPSGRPRLDDRRSFRRGRTVAQATARLQVVVARAGGTATVTGDLLQRRAGRTSAKLGSRTFGRDGLATRLSGTGPVVITVDDEGKWTHSVGGTLVAVDLP
jgi:hypothetical protein